jgi:hypothetical protein
MCKTQFTSLVYATIGLKRIEFVGFEPEFASLFKTFVGKRPQVYLQNGFAQVVILAIRTPLSNVRWAEQKILRVSPAY